MKCRIGGVITIKTRESSWWGTSLEFQADIGENLSNFNSGYLHFDIRGDSDIGFNIGFQTGRYLDGDQINSFVSFGPGSNKLVSEKWTSYKVPMTELNNGTDLVDVTGILSLLGQHRAENKQLFLKNIYYTQK